MTSAEQMETTRTSSEEVEVGKGGGGGDEIHPLHNEWTVWEHHQSTVSTVTSYSQNMQELYSFKTVQDFWKFWNNYPKPSDIFFDGRTKKKITREGESQGKCINALSIFKKGIKPEWEDEQNKNGGEWNLRKIADLSTLDKAFENLLLAMVGETLDEGNEICGLRVLDKSKRKTCMYRIELWIRSENAKTAIKARVHEAASDGMPRGVSVGNLIWRGHK